MKQPEHVPAFDTKLQSTCDPETWRLWSEGISRFTRTVAEKHFQRLSAFTEEQSDPRFKSVADKYNRVMWVWVMSRTSDDLLKAVNSCQFLPPANPINEAELKRERTLVMLYYLLRRTVFLEGLEHGHAHCPEWLKTFSPELLMARHLDDSIFEAVVSAKQKRESKKPIPGWGQLRYKILLTWLAGGLWRLPSDAERSKALNRLWEDDISEKATEEGFKRARQRIELKAGQDC